MNIWFFYSLGSQRRKEIFSYQILLFLELRGLIGDLEIKRIE